MGVLVIIAFFVAIVALMTKSVNRRKEEQEAAWIREEREEEIKREKERKEEQQREQERRQAAIEMIGFNEKAAQYGKKLFDDPEIKKEIDLKASLMGLDLSSHFRMYGTNILSIEANSTYFTYRTDDGMMKAEMVCWDDWVNFLQIPYSQENWTEMVETQALLWAIERLAAEKTLKSNTDIKKVYCEIEEISNHTIYTRLFASEFE